MENNKMTKITQNGDPVLRKKAEEIPPEEIGLAETQQLIKKMSEALYESDLGVGIAAPQIGVSRAIFLVSEEAVLADKITPEEHEKKKKRDWKHLVFINPRIIKSSQKKDILHEGCLSVEGVFGMVERYKQVMVEAYNEKGEKFRVGAGGLYAQVLQHEIDHLNGILFIDKATNVEKVVSEK